MEGTHLCTISDDDVCKYQGRLLAYLRKLTQDEDEVLVLSQEVWLRVIKYKVILQQGVDQFPTLARIARNAFLEVRRRNRLWVPLGPENEPIFSENYQNLDREELMQRLQQFLLTFPSSEQKVFWFRYKEDGLSWEDLADTLGISVHTAKKQYRRTLGRLRAKLPSTLH
jgi:RNA polymerase sigma factor (sigma-70 family)